MSFCESCPIEEKLLLCCGREPETGKQAVIQLDNGETVAACPYLNRNGKCKIYDNRPSGCRAYFCDVYNVTKSVPGINREDIAWFSCFQLLN